MTASRTIIATAISLGCVAMQASLAANDGKHTTKTGNYGTSAPGHPLVALLRGIRFLPNKPFENDVNAFRLGLQWAPQSNCKPIK